ncbi:MAG TPA: hypothetical protein VE011_11635 [Candidatus Dormibacteraeota bacterium]|nr:hypothetical protein [Candidatus Dormibacteraeota bacterium]
MIELCIVTSDERPSALEDHMHVDRRLLGWGLFFILVGGIQLATHAGLLDPNVVGQWPLLWPVLLIAWGAGLLLRSTPIEWIGGALAAITFGVMGGGALAAGFGGIPIASGCGNTTTGVPFASRSGDFGSTASAQFEFSCGTFSVTAVDGSTWGLSGSDRAGTGPVVTTGPRSLSVRAAHGSNLFDAAGRSVWNVTLPRSPVLGLGVTLNAGEGTIDLAGVTVSSATLNLNAGDLTVDLSGTTRTGDVNATVNAGSATVSLPAGDRAVNMSLNAGSLQVCLPPSTPVRVAWSGALGSNNFDGNGLVKLDQNTWTSAGFDANQPHVELHVSANAGSFELQFGGSCGA